MCGGPVKEASGGALGEYIRAEEETVTQRRRKEDGISKAGEGHAGDRETKSHMAAKQEGGTRPFHQEGELCSRKILWPLGR